MSSRKLEHCLTLLVRPCSSCACHKHFYRNSLSFSYCGAGIPTLGSVTSSCTVYTYLWPADGFEYHQSEIVMASGTQPSDHCECCCSIWSPIPGDPFWGSTHPQITDLTERAQKSARSHQPQILARVWWQGTGLLQISVTCLTQSEPQNMTQIARICGAWIASWLETWVLCAQISFYPMKKDISALNLLTEEHFLFLGILLGNRLGHNCRAHLDHSPPLSQKMNSGSYMAPAISLMGGGRGPSPRLTVAHLS